MLWVENAFWYWLFAVCSRHAPVHKRQLQHAATRLFLLRLRQLATAKQLSSLNGWYGSSKPQRHSNWLPAILYVHNASSLPSPDWSALRVCVAPTAFPLAGVICNTSFCFCFLEGLRAKHQRSIKLPNVFLSQRAYFKFFKKKDLCFSWCFYFKLDIPF